MTTPDPAPLEDVLARAAALPQMDLRARIQWLQDTAAAADAAGLGAAGAEAALHLRAAIGAVVQWSRAPDASSPERIAELETLMRTLIARGTAGLYRALASAYEELAKQKPPHRAAVVAVRDAFTIAASAVERGEPVPSSVQAALDDVRKALP